MAVAASSSPDQEEHVGPLFLLKLDVKKFLGRSFLCSAWKRFAVSVKPASDRVVSRLGEMQRPLRNM